jgi:hypothetical protein
MPIRISPTNSIMAILGYWLKCTCWCQSRVERAWQSIRLVRRWWPDRALVFVADSSVGALEWLALVAGLLRVNVITRLQLDAALYAPPLPHAPGQRGRPRLQGKRPPTLEAVVADEKTQWTKLTIDDWYREGPGGCGRHRHCGMVSRGQAACRHPLSPHSRSASALTVSLTKISYAAAPGY